MSGGIVTRVSASAAMTPSDERIARVLASLARERAPASFCPSEAARRLATEWRPLMEDVRRVAAMIPELRATQGDVEVDPQTASGPIRLRLTETD